METTMFRLHLVLL